MTMPRVSLGICIGASCLLMLFGIGVELSQLWPYVANHF